MSTAETPDSAGNAGTREKILAAALQIFSERGFEGARTRDIAERAGANLGLIKYYFDTKEQLWKAAVDRAFEILTRDFQELMAPSSEVDERVALEQMIRRFVRFCAESPEFIRLMNDEGKRDGPRMRWLVDRHVKPMYELVRRRVESAQAKGMIPAIPVVSTHYIMVGAAGLLFSQAPECERMTGIDPTEKATVEAHADAVVRLLMGDAT